MTETPTPKKSGFGCVLPAIAAAVLIGGGGAAAYWMLNRTRAAEMTAAANAAVLPDETIAIAHLTTTTFDDLAQFGTSIAQEETRRRVDALLTGFSPGLEWERDLKPWVGSITLGLATPTAQETASGSDLHAYFAIAIRDKLQAIKFASSLKAEAGETAIESDYKGIKLIQISPDEAGRGTTIATMGNHLILAGSLGNMQNVIDDIQAKTAANRSEKLQQALGQSPKVDRPLLQVYIPDTSAFPSPQPGANTAQPKDEAPDETSEEPGQTSGEPSPKNAAETINTPPIRASIATVNVTDTGLHGSINVFFNEGQELPKFVPISDRPERQFPEQTVLLLAGNTIAETWTQLVTRAASNTAPLQAQQSLALIRDGFSQIGLDADRDIFSWMDGEAAIGAFPVTTGLLQQFGLAAAVTVETSDRTAATAALGKLSEAIKSRLPIPLTQTDRQAGTIAIQEWTVPVPGIGTGGLFGYGWRDDRNLIVGLSAPAIDALAQPRDTSLAANPDFQDVMQDLPSEKTGYAYFNLGQVYQQLQGLPAGANPLLSTETMALLSATRSLGTTFASETPNQLTINLALALQPFTASDRTSETPDQTDSPGQRNPEPPNSEPSNTPDISPPNAPPNAPTLPE